MNNIILVVTHKDVKILNNDLYKPIIVGTQDITIPNSLRDNTGDNIADKNPEYCEMTAVYWAWRNLERKYDNIGLCHYRRYFTKKGFTNSSKYYLTNADIDKCLSKYDIILPSEYKWNHNVGEIYYNYGNGKKKDLELLKSVINELYPEYVVDFDKCISKKSASYCNMFVMSWEHYDKYCKWLFDILFCMEKKIDMNGYSKQERRALAFLCEILLNIWVKHNKFKVCYFDMAYTEKDFMGHIKMYIKTHFIRRN